MKSIYDQEYRSLVQKIVMRRKSLGMTQADLALRLRLEQSIISKIETHVRRIDIIETKKICAALNWTLEELLRAGN